MELRDTVKMMLSDDYKERFKAEYWQTKIRYEKLRKILIKDDANTLDFELKCAPYRLSEQESLMQRLLWMLEARAEIEDIDLDDIDLDDHYEKPEEYVKQIVRITIDCDEETGDKITEFLDNLIAAEE